MGIIPIFRGLAPFSLETPLVLHTLTFPFVLLACFCLPLIFYFITWDQDLNPSLAGFTSVVGLDIDQICENCRHFHKIVSSMGAAILEKEVNNASSGELRDFPCVG